MGITSRQHQILIAITAGASTLSDLLALSGFWGVTSRTVQRDLVALIEAGLLERHGENRGASYSLSQHALIDLVVPKEELLVMLQRADGDPIRYDFGRLDALANVELFTLAERRELEEFDRRYRARVAETPEGIRRRERERIMIELSWKSSQFEGNTYSLFETEVLLKDGQAARGKSAEDTQMILNHKRALDFVDEHPELFTDVLRPQAIIELHRHLAEGLFESGLRERLVRITGTAYEPLDNRFQIEEQLGRLCDVVNRKDSVYEKALLALVFMAYLQSFNDGNKRTGRILANAILHAHGSFPLSLRAVDGDVYRFAILAFYELGALGNAKQVLLEQARFAAENYAG